MSGRRQASQLPGLQTLVLHSSDCERNSCDEKHSRVPSVDYFFSLFSPRIATHHSSPPCLSCIHIVSPCLSCQVPTPWSASANPGPGLWIQCCHWCHGAGPVDTMLPEAPASRGCLVIARNKNMSHTVTQEMCCIVWCHSEGVS